MTSEQTQTPKMTPSPVPARTAPADAVFAFAAWLTTRHERVGPFSRTDDSAPMAHLAGLFCEFQHWEISNEWPNTFDMPPDGGSHPETGYWNGAPT